MIVDTTYFLPLVGIDIDEDLLKAIDENQVRITFSDIKISLITIFELQAKAAKLGIDSDTVVKGINAILKSFEIIPFSESEIIRVSFKLREKLNDYIDCVIVATAVNHGKKLVTEDEDIISIRDLLRREYGLRVYTFRELLKS